MSDIYLKCVFCGETNLQKTIKFKLETLKKCINILEYRRSKPVLRKSRTTYNNLELSIESSLIEVYHAQCYKLFTAIKIPRDLQYLQEQTDNASEVSGECSKSHAIVEFTSTEAAGTSTDEAGGSSNIHEDFEDFKYSFKVDPAAHNDSESQTCFICEKQRKQHHGREVHLAINRLKTMETLKNAATEQNDIPMLEKLSSFSDSNISYHKCCKDQYLREIYRDENSEFLRKRRVSNTAYTILCNMLEERVVKNNKCLLFNSVKKEYQKLLEQHCSLLPNSIPISSFSDRHFERKLMKTFAKKIKFIYAEKKKFLAPFSAILLTYKDLYKTMAVKETICSVARRRMKKKPITPDILEDIQEIDTQSEDEIEPEEEDDSTDEDDELIIKK